MMVIFRDQISVPIPKIFVHNIDNIDNLDDSDLEDPNEENTEDELKTPSISLVDNNEIDEVATISKNKLLVTVVAGDNLSKIMKQARISNSDIALISNILKPIYNPKSLSVGNKIEFNFDDIGQLLSLNLIVNPEKTVNILKEGDGFKAEVIASTLDRWAAKAEGIIQNSLFISLKKNSLNNKIISDVLKISKQVINLEKDIKSGNKFEVIYEKYYDQDGNFVKTGGLLYFALNLNNKNITFYKFADHKNEVNFYDKNGISIAKAFFKNPVQYRRISGKFGMRKHPILGYVRHHAGVDFAAPAGTPIYAAANGKITMISYFGGYGKYVKIKHNNTYSTGYGHMSKFNKNIKVGSYVKQGDLIGFVGSTGLASGPHLHYEIMVNNKHVDPLSVATKEKLRLSGKDLDKFKAYVNKINKLSKSIGGSGSIAYKF